MVSIEGTEADMTDLRAWFATKGITTAAKGTSALTLSWKAPSGESVIDLPGAEDTTVFSALGQGEKAFRISVDIEEP